MLPLPGGFLFVASQSEYEEKQGEQESKRMLVSYRMCSFERAAVVPVTRSVYLQAKLGPNYGFFEHQLKDLLNYICVPLPEKRTLMLYRTGDASIFAADGEIVWTGRLSYHESGPADAVCSGNSVWVTFPDGDTIVRYNARTMREELRIGSKRDNAFSKPYGLWLQDGALMVSNAASQNIERVDVDAYTVEQYAQFEEPVYQYLKINSNEIVLLRSGIYRL